VLSEDFKETLNQPEQGLVMEYKAGFVTQCRHLQSKLCIPEHSIKSPPAPPFSNSVRLISCLPLLCIGFIAVFYNSADKKLFANDGRCQNKALCYLDLRYISKYRAEHYCPFSKGGMLPAYSLSLSKGDVVLAIIEATPALASFDNAAFPL
jgi:hypothetical protein